MNQRQPVDPWERGRPYEEYVGRWSRRVAPLFLSWLHVPAGRRWVDVGCGTGALCAAILDHGSPSSVVGIEPSEGFLETAKENLGEEVKAPRKSRRLSSAMSLQPHSLAGQRASGSPYLAGSLNQATFSCVSPGVVAPPPLPSAGTSMGVRLRYSI
jgi:SAM-dependent methyltransferase